MEISIESVHKLDELGENIVNDAINSFQAQSKFIVNLSRNESISGLLGVFFSMMYKETGVTPEEFIQICKEMGPELMRKKMYAENTGTKLKIR